LEATGWDRSDLDWVISHQTLLKALHRGADILEIPRDRVPITLDRYGNMVSVSLPFTLATTPIQSGAKVLLTGFGSGLGIGMLTLQF
jgi:3-oxoacyl-[acyl-carrier-protein] synthase-3